MKFTDGFWSIKKGINIYGITEVNDIEINDDSIIAYATPIHIHNKRDVVDTPLLSVKFSSPMENIIRVQLYHFKGTVKERPNFFINEQSNLKFEINENEDEFILKSGKLSVKIKKKGDWSVNFYTDDKKITGSGFKSMAYIIAEDDNTYMREQLDLDVDEYVYGLGERFTPFVKNGQIVDIWNDDGGTSSEQAYKNIPFYITNRGYGILVNDPGKVSFEIASENVSKVQFSVSGEYLEYYIINGPTMKDVLNNYTSLTGKPALPPAWSFGLWLSTSFTTNYDEKTIMNLINGMLERDIPISSFHFDTFWMKEFQWCDFEWDIRRFPDPQNVLKKIEDKGIKISVWINPYIAQKSKLFDEASKQGYLLKKSNGDIWQCDSWQAGMSVVDFTNPQACEWYAGKLRKLVDMGVDFFKTDFGEDIPTDVIYYDKSDPQKMHNYYTFLYNKVVYSVLYEKKGKENAVLFARSATVGNQQFPVHWGGDNSATYESMAESLRGGLSLSLSGFGFWSHDIGGFEGTPTPDLYKRWTAFGLLSSHSRLHGDNVYKVPWLYDEEAVDVLRFFTKLKYKLMPYLFNVAVKAMNEGIPVMRPMVMEFTNDPTCYYLDKQYMLGSSLLVAPIFNEEGIVTYYLPKGNWTNFLTGEVAEGEKWRKEKHNYMSLPLMVRPNSIIATGNIDMKPDYDYSNNVTFQIFELENGVQTNATVQNLSGQIEIELIALRDDDTIKINIVQKTMKRWNVLLRGIEKIKFIDNASYNYEKSGIRVIPKETISSITIKL
ncbi:MAG: alpha-xylosidase [Thermotogae bacterium]|jgi:alpha-D-xyloside xylohydrolase|nr:alpha-xylosidase [Thermotogota bacterium]